MLPSVILLTSFSFCCDRDGWRWISILSRNLETLRAEVQDISEGKRFNQDIWCRRGDGMIIHLSPVECPHRQNQLPYEFSKTRNYHIITLIGSVLGVLIAVGFYLFASGFSSMNKSGLVDQIPQQSRSNLAQSSSASR